MKTLIFLITIITLFSCNSNRKVTDEDLTQKNTIAADSNYRFSVSFISIGAGTDKKAKQQYDKYIIEYEKKNKVNVNYEVISWGREGEIDYCFKLTELDKKKQELFITETKEILKGSSLVRYKENAPCRQRKK